MSVCPGTPGNSADSPATREVFMSSTDVGTAKLPYVTQRILFDASGLRSEAPRSQRLLRPAGSKVLATVSRHMLGLTKDGAVLGYAVDGICWT